MWSYVGYEGDVGNTLEPVEDDEFLIFNNYHFMTMSMDYALATITGTKTLTGGNLEAGEFRFGLYDSNGTLIDTKTNDASGNITFRIIQQELILTLQKRLMSRVKITLAILNMIRLYIPLR